MNQAPARAGRNFEAFSPRSGGEVFLCPDADDVSREE